MKPQQSDIPKHARGNDIFETTRNAAIESAAALLGTLSKARDLKRRAQAALEERAEFDKDVEKNEPRDFLFDMLRLNASYLNELAKLGSHHKDLVHRALENLYASASKSMNGKDRVLQFTRDQLLQTFILQNDVLDGQGDPVPVYLTWDNVLEAHDLLAKDKDPFSFSVPKGATLSAIKPGSCTISVPFGVPTVVTMKVTEQKAHPFLDRKYETTLRVTLPLPNGRSQVRRIPVELNMRRPTTTTDDKVGA